MTGHANGLITMNVEEADDVKREISSCATPSGYQVVTKWLPSFTTRDPQKGLYFSLFFDGAQRQTEAACTLNPFYPVGQPKVILV